MKIDEKRFLSSLKSQQLNQNTSPIFQIFSQIYFLVQGTGRYTNWVPCRNTDQRRIEVPRTWMGIHEMIQIGDGTKFCITTWTAGLKRKQTFKKFMRAVVPVFWGPKMIKSGKFLHLSRRAAGNISRCRLSSHGLVQIGDFASIGFCWKYFCAISDGVVWTSRKFVHFETNRNKWPKV